MKEVPCVAAQSVQGTVNIQICFGRVEDKVRKSHDSKWLSTKMKSDKKKFVRGEMLVR